MELHVIQGFLMLAVYVVAVFYGGRWLGRWLGWVPARNDVSPATCVYYLVVTLLLAYALIWMR